MTWTGKNEVLDEVIGRAELERMLDEAGGHLYVSADSGGRHGVLERRAGWQPLLC